MKRRINLFIGPILFSICYFLLPRNLFESVESRTAIGTVIWMAYWWISAPVDYAVTAFLPISVNAIFPMIEMKQVIENYASETVILLLGAAILTASWEITGLDKRIAICFLKILGGGFRKQLIFWFIFSALLSSILPNIVVCATITPIAIAMLKYIGENNISKSRIGSKILLTIVYATGVGGIFTPLGGSMNLIIVDYIQQLTGKEYWYFSWIIIFSPVVIVLIISNILFLIRDIKNEEQIGGIGNFVLDEEKEIGKISIEEKYVLLLFVLAVVLSFSRKLFQDAFPNLKPAYCFIICALFIFGITLRKKSQFINWKSIQNKIVWELIFVFAGGLAAGALINNSGAADAIGKLIARVGVTGGFGTISIIILVTILLSDITSNTATAAITIPIVISVIKGINLNPVPYIYISTIGINLSYMLPTSIRAIPVGYGLEPSYMFKEGWRLTVIVWILMSLVSFLGLKYLNLFELP